MANIGPRSYFWSSDFWGAVNYKHPSPGRKTFIIMLLIVSGILAVLAGPTSAVLMIPREMDWKTGGGIFWLNGMSMRTSHWKS